MWSFVGKKERQYWLWHVIDHRTGKILTYALGRRTDEVYRQLRKLLRPFGNKTPRRKRTGYFRLKLVISIMRHKWRGIKTPPMRFNDFT